MDWRVKIPAMGPSLVRRTLAFVQASRTSQKRCSMAEICRKMLHDAREVAYKPLIDQLATRPT